MSGNEYVRPLRDEIRVVLPPTPLAAYIVMKVAGTDEVYFYAMRFAAMRLDMRDPNAENVVVDGIKYMQGMGGWMKRWRHWSQRGAREGRTVGFYDMPYIRCFEEVKYQKRVSAYVHDPVEQRKECASDVSLQHVHFEKPYDQNWLIRRHEHFYGDLEMETRFSCDRSVGGVFAGWHNIEAF